MSLCLLVYSIGQRELIKTLKRSNSTVSTEISAKCFSLRTAQIEWQNLGIEKRVEAIQQWKKILFLTKKS